MRKTTNDARKPHREIPKRDDYIVDIRTFVRIVSERDAYYNTKTLDYCIACD